MRKYKKWMLAGLVLILAGAFVCTAYVCRDKKRNKTLSLIYIPKTEDGTNDFWTSLISGTKMAAKEYNAEITILAPSAEQDIKMQYAYLEEAIQEKPDAILLSPSSFTDYNELLRGAKKKKIPIVFIDSYTSENVQDLTVATNNLEVGRKLGEYARSLVDDQAQIAIVSYVKGVSTSIEREQGFREGLADQEKNIVEVVYCNSQFDKAYELTQDLMEKYPDLKMIAGMNEYSSVGAARAVKDAGAQERIKIIGVDSSQEAVELMEQGVFRCLVVQKAFKMGYLGVKETIRMLRGESYNAEVDSGCEFVTPDNMYNPEIEKLLFPFSSIKKIK